jgi:hypothetical protein
MAAMDIFMPGIRTGNFAPWRASGFAGNHLIHSSFIPAKSVSSRRMTVALTTRSREVPARSNDGRIHMQKTPVSGGQLRLLAKHLDYAH